MYVDIIQIVDGPLEAAIGGYVRDYASAFTADGRDAPVTSLSPEGALPYTATNMAVLRKVWPAYAFVPAHVNAAPIPIGASAVLPWEATPPESPVVRSILRVQQILPYYYVDVQRTLRLDEEFDYLSDIIADLMHYMQARGIRAAEAVARATEHFNEEHNDHIANIRTVVTANVFVIVPAASVEMALAMGVVPDRESLRAVLVKACGERATVGVQDTIDSGDMALTFIVRDVSPGNMQACRDSLSNVVHNTLNTLMTNGAQEPAGMQEG